MRGISVKGAGRPTEGWTLIIKITDIYFGNGGVTLRQSAAHVTERNTKMGRLIGYILFLVVACLVVGALFRAIGEAGMMPPCVSASALMLAATAVFAATAGKVR